MAITVNGVKVAGAGPAGLSPYQVAVAGGYTGTEQEFNQSLAQLNQLFTSVSEGKSAIAAAITDLGVTTAADATFSQMAENLNGVPRQQATTITAGTAAQTAIPAGTYAAGAATVSGDANLVSDNIKEGVSIFGVVGSFAGGGESVLCTIQSNFSGGLVKYTNQNGAYAEAESGSFYVLKNSIVLADSGSPRGTADVVGGQNIGVIAGAYQMGFTLSVATADMTVDLY